MSKLLHIKGSRTKIFSSLPSNEVGNDGDIILSTIKGKGNYLCAKINGRWNVANKLEDLNKIGKTSIKNLGVDMLRIGNATLIQNQSGININQSTTIDKNAFGDIAENLKGLYIDFDRTVAGSGTAAHNDIGIDLDVNSASLGTSSVKGMDIDVVGATSGTHTAIGIDLDVDSADTNIGILINTAGTHMKLVANADTDDYATLAVANTGDLTIATVGDGSNDSDLTLDVDGDLILDPSTQKTIINATDGLYFDGGTHTYIAESSADNLRFTVGGTILLDLTEALINSVNVNAAILTVDSQKPIYFDGGSNTYIVESSADVLDIKVGNDLIFQITESAADGNTIDIENACIGFTQIEPTYDATTTVVDFRHSNKQNLTFGSGSITNLTLYFPLVSGNFQLLIKQDGTGSRTITNYKVYEFDESLADGSVAVIFAGGSNPTLTTDANHVDILSFYWDADNEIAYGVATLDFQF